MKTLDDNPRLAGLSDDEIQIMGRLLRMRPEQQKTSPKPTGARAEGQRRRREKERETEHGGREQKIHD